MNQFTNLFDRVGRNAMLNAVFLGITLLLSFIAWLGIYQLQSTLEDFEQNIATRQEMLQRGDELKQISLDLKEELGSMTSQLAALRAKLPDSPEESQFLYQLSEQATASGVSLSDFRPGGTTQRTNCKDIELRLRGTGHYANVCRWIDSLANLPRLVRIANITISGPALAGGDCVVDIQLNMIFGVSAQPPLVALAKP